MTYPYGTKGAPVVGNGLGGLPRRAVAAAAVVVSAGPQILQRSGDVVIAGNGSQGVQGISFGRILGDSPGAAIFKYSFIDGGGNTNYAIGGATYSSTGITGALSAANTGTTASPWNTFNWANSWSAGDSVFYINSSSDVYRIRISSGTTLSHSLVKSTAIPATGTLTVGGASYSIYESFSSRVIGDNEGNSGVMCAKMTGGNVLCARYAVLAGSVMALVGFVLDSSFNIVRSFQFRQLFTNTTSVGRTAMILPVSDATDTFSVFCIIGQTGTTAFAHSATVNAATGNQIALSQSTAFSVPDQNWLSTSTYVIGRNFLKVTFNESSVSTRTATFQINSDLSVVGNSTTTFGYFNNGAATAMPQLRYYDFDYRDYFNHSVSTTAFDPPIEARGTGFYSSVAPAFQQLSNLSYTNTETASTASISVMSLRGLAIVELDPATDANNTGYGPYPMVRVGTNAFIGGFIDRFSTSNIFWFKTQLLRAAT